MNEETAKEATAVSQEKNQSEDGEESQLPEEATIANDNCSKGELTVYVEDYDKTGTNIRNSPNGDVVLTLPDEEGEAEYMLRLTESKNGWFKVLSPVEGMESDVEIPNGEGWIHHSVIAVGTRNYGGKELELLDNHENGKVVGVIKEEVYGLRVKELCGSWVKVDYKGTIGWIEESWLCGIPWTTCP